jgi:hypothetical protein
MLRALRRPRRVLAGLFTAVVWLLSVAQRPSPVGGERRELEPNGPVYATAVVANAHLLRGCDEGCVRHPSQHSVAAASQPAAPPAILAGVRIAASPRDARGHGTWHRTAPHDATAPPQSR